MSSSGVAALSLDSDCPEPLGQPYKGRLGMLLMVDPWVTALPRKMRDRKERTAPAAGLVTQLSATFHTTGGKGQAASHCLYLLKCQCL